MILHAHLPATEIVCLLRSKAAACGRAVPESEIVAAVQNSAPVAWRPNGRGVGVVFKAVTMRPAVQKMPKWPEVDAQKRGNIICAGGGLTQLCSLSPVQYSAQAEPTQEVIDRFFPGNPLLCCGKSGYEFTTKPKAEWGRQLSQLALIVPATMTALTGLTKEGKVSAHALSNTGPRRFLVCEFDRGTEDEQAALLLHLATFAPLACVVHSGGKSLHGWFCVADETEAGVLRFFRYAVSLGADPALWTRSQFARMPGGTRDIGKRQAILFFNPGVVK